MPGPKPAYPQGPFANARPSQWQAFDPSASVRKVVPEAPSNQSNEVEAIEPIRPGEDAS